jgi:crotonobetainyl-CoA:carnitine CoA-transferase CaiB-like acyl-CoA transferase
MEELAQTDWAIARHVLIDADDRSGDTFRVPNSPWVFSGSNTSTRGVPKFRGEDNAEVFTSILGLSAEEVAALTESGALSIRLPKK